MVRLVDMRLVDYSSFSGHGLLVSPCYTNYVVGYTQVLKL
jgi:hypothetical protein